MTPVDTSVWIDFLRDTPTSTSAFLSEQIGRSLHTTEPVLLELLAGARTGQHTDRLERMLLSQTWCRLEPGLDYRGAVDVFQTPAAPAISHVRSTTA